MDSSRRFRVSFDFDKITGKAPVIEYRVSDIKMLVAMLEATGDPLNTIKAIVDVTDRPEHCNPHGGLHDFIASAWMDVRPSGMVKMTQVVEMHCQRCLYRINLPIRKEIR